MFTERNLTKSQLIAEYELFNFETFSVGHPVYLLGLSVHLSICLSPEESQHSPLGGGGGGRGVGGRVNSIFRKRIGLLLNQS